MQKKYTKSELSSVKSIPLASLLAARGVSATKNGRGYICHCPFHKEKTPSFRFDDKTNLWRCFGQCDEGGDTIRFIEKSEGLGFVEAVKLLQDKYLIHEQRGEAMQTTKNENGDNDSIDIATPAVQKVLVRYIEYHAGRLKDLSLPVDYLMKRNIIHGEIVEEQEIGYCDGTFLEKLNPDDDRETMQILSKLSLLSRHGNRFVERFTGGIIVPVKDANGIIYQIYARACSKEANFKHTMLSAKLDCLFNEKALIAKEIFLCESIFDALSLQSFGYANVVSSLGVNGVSNVVLDKLTDAEISKVILAFDNDKAGDKASAKLTERLKELGISVSRIHFPKQLESGQSIKDANDLLCKTEKAAEVFSSLVAEAAVLFEVSSSATILEESSDKESFNKEGDEYHFKFGERVYLGRGLFKNKDDFTLKTLLKATYQDKFFIDTVDLFQHKQSSFFTKHAGDRIDLDEKIIGADVDKITLILEKELKKFLSEKDKPQKVVSFKTNIALESWAIAFLKKQDFIIDFLDTTNECALVGENLNVTFGFISTLTRFHKKQIHLIIQSESSTGKSTLLNLLADFVPEEDKFYFTIISAKSLYHGEENALSQKALFIAEMQGLSEAHQALQQMMTEGKLINYYTMTDPKTGKFINMSNTVYGPMQCNITLPNEDLFEDLNNRCGILVMDDSEEQQERIMAFQRLLESPDGAHILKQRELFTEKMQHVQRALRIKKAVNYHTKHLYYRANVSNRLLRDNQRYLLTIKLFAIWFQFQREVVIIDGEEFVRVHVIDVALGNFLFKRTLGKSLTLLAPQTNNVVNKLATYYKKYAKDNNLDFHHVWFTRKASQEITKLSVTRTHEHLKMAEEAGYFASKRTAEGIKYRFLFDPDGYKCTIELCDINELLKKVSKKEREEYQAFLPVLHRIFKKLDPNWKVEDGI